MWRVADHTKVTMFGNHACAKRFDEPLVSNKAAIREASKKTRDVCLFGDGSVDAHRLATIPGPLSDALRLAFHFKPNQTSTICSASSEVGEASLNRKLRVDVQRILNFEVQICGDLSLQLFDLVT